MNQDEHRYDDMLYMPHHVSGTHRHMSMKKRAAQFIPFSALNGFDDRIEESRRTVDQRRLLSAFQKEELDKKMSVLLKQERPTLTVVYFAQDELKEGGSYKEKTGVLKRVDKERGVLVFTDREEIPVSLIDDLRF